MNSRNLGWKIIWNKFFLFWNFKAVDYQMKKFRKHVSKNILKIITFKTGFTRHTSPITSYFRLFQSTAKLTGTVWEINENKKITAIIHLLKLKILLNRKNERVLLLFVHLHFFNDVINSYFFLFLFFSGSLVISFISKHAITIWNKWDQRFECIIAAW